MKGINLKSNSFLMGTMQLFIILMLFSGLMGQGYEISGRVFKEDGKGKLGPVRIVLYDQNKKKVVELEQPGKFKLKNIPDGKYMANFYGPDGYGKTHNIEIAGDNKKDLSITLNPNPDQVQIKSKPEVSGAALSWKSIRGASNYIIYRDNQEITTVSGTAYLDEISPGQTFAYNVIVVKTDQSMGTRSITEYGKALINAPSNLTAEAKKNSVKLEWFPVENATGYNVYRDDDKINTTTEQEYTDYKLKYNEDYSYMVVATDHHQKEGKKSNEQSIKTHKEVKKVINRNKKNIFVLNKKFKLGISSSINTGLRKISKKDKGFIIVQSDMPFIKTSDINKIYNSIIKKKHLVHALKFKNKIGNPIGFDSLVLAKFKRMKGEVGAKFMVKRLKKNTNFIKVLNKRVFKDLDLRKDFN